MIESFCHQSWSLAIRIIVVEKVVSLSGAICRSKPGPGTSAVRSFCREHVDTYLLLDLLLVNTIGALS